MGWGALCGRGMSGGEGAPDGFPFLVEEGVCCIPRPHRPASGEEQRQTGGEGVAGEVCNVFAADGDETVLAVEGVKVGGEGGCGVERREAGCLRAAARVWEGGQVMGGLDCSPRLRCPGIPCRRGQRGAGRVAPGG